MKIFLAILLVLPGTVASVGAQKRASGPLCATNQAKKPIAWPSVEIAAAPPVVLAALIRAERREGYRNHAGEGGRVTFVHPLGRGSKAIGSVPVITSDLSLSYRDTFGFWTVGKLTRVSGQAELCVDHPREAFSCASKSESLDLSRLRRILRSIKAELEK